MIQKFNFQRNFNFDISNLYIGDLKIIGSVLEEEERNKKAKLEELERKRMMDIQKSKTDKQAQKYLNSIPKIK